MAYRRSYRRRRSYVAPRKRETFTARSTGVITFTQANRSPEWVDLLADYQDTVLNQADVSGTTIMGIRGWYTFAYNEKSIGTDPDRPNILSVGIKTESEVVYRQLDTSTERGYYAPGSEWGRYQWWQYRRLHPLGFHTDDSWVNEDWQFKTNYTPVRVKSNRRLKSPADSLYLIANQSLPGALSGGDWELQFDLSIFCRKP